MNVPQKMWFLGYAAPVIIHNHLNTKPSQRGELIACSARSTDMMEKEAFRSIGAEMLRNASRYKQRCIVHIVA